MEQNQLPKFMLITAINGAEIVVNLDQVCFFDQISAEHIRLVFTGGHKVDLQGAGAKELIAFLADNCVSTDGKTKAMALHELQSPYLGQA